MGYYRDLILKEAGAAQYVSKIDDIIETVMKAGGKSRDEAVKVVRESMDKGGTGSMFVDAALYPFKKISKKPKEAIPEGLSRSARKTLIKEKPDLYKRQPRFKDKIEDTIWNYKSKIDNADMAIGKRLGKNNKFFDQDVRIKMDDDDIGGVERILKTKRATAPISKFKDFIVPTVGSYTIAGKIYGDPNQKKGGGNFEGQYNQVR